MNTLTTTPMLDLLIADLDHAVHTSPPGLPTVLAVQAALRPALGLDSLLRREHQEGDPHRYRQHVLHAAPDGSFSVVALVWQPGQATPIHDHLAWCVVGVHQGAETEIRFEEQADGRLLETGYAVAEVGDVAGLMPPGDIHLVRNAGVGPAISLHVYGADVTDSGSSIRRTYDDVEVTDLAS